MLESERVGTVVKNFERVSYEDAAARALSLADDPATGARCAEVARRCFDLESIGIARYREVYRRIGESAAGLAAGWETS